MRALRIVLVALALVLASLVLVPASTAAQPPGVASCAEAREPGGGWVLLLTGSNLNAVRSVSVSTGAGAPIGGATIASRSKTLLTVRIPPVIARPAYPLPGDYRVDLITSRQTVPVAVRLGLGCVDGDAIDGKIDVSSDDGAVLTGSLGTGSIPASGAGTRFMWYPGKAALRAGSALADEWDDVNVGTYSVAMGFQTRASAQAAIALGEATTASGNRSTALGVSTTAAGTGATALGGATTASGDYSTAAGNLSTASGGYSTALGDRTAAGGACSTALGGETRASGEYSIAAGYLSTASGIVSTALGNRTAASGDYSTATGTNTIASGGYSTAIGTQTTASGVASFAAGSLTTASGAYSTTTGAATEAYGNYATAFGMSTSAQAQSSLAIGQYNVIAGSNSTWVATDPLLVAGNGPSFSTRSNALTLLKNGNLTIAGTLTQNSDERLKKDVAPLSDVLPRLAGVRGVSYEFKDQTTNPAGRHLGLLAQEVRRAFPELVSEDASGNLSVAYGNFAAVLLEAVKEQQREIAARDRELADLRERVARLERLVGAVPAATDSK